MKQKAEHSVKAPEMDEKRDIYPFELIKTGIKILETTRFRKGQIFHPSRPFVVYQLIEVAFGSGYLPLNRDYKPLGLDEYNNWADYDAYPFLVIPKDKVNLSELEFTGHFTPGHFFFNDGTTPREKKSVDRYIKMVKEAFAFNDH